MQDHTQSAETRNREGAREAFIAGYTAAVAEMAEGERRSVVAALEVISAQLRDPPVSAMAALDRWERG